MTLVREELNRLLRSLSEEELCEVRDFVKVLSLEPEDLSEEDLREVIEGEEQFRRGEWEKWHDVKRRNV